MSWKNRFRWGLGLVAAGILICCMPLAALASERTMTGAEKTSEPSVGPRTNDTDKSGGLVFEWLNQVPTVETVFTAGGGTAVWTPVLQDGKVVSGTLALKNVMINNNGGMGINFPVPVDIKVEGSNQITSKSIGIYLADRATGNPLDLKIAGSGSLEIISQDSGVQTAGNIVIDTARLDVVYGSSSAVGRHGLLTVGGDIEIENSTYVKVKSNPAGIGNGSSAICAGQNRGQTVRITNSHVIAITGEGSAIDANAGKIELVSSDVRAIGKTGDGSGMLGAAGVLAYFQGCTLDGGTLFAQNNGADLEIPSTPDVPLRASNSAVLYGVQESYILPLAGDLVWHKGCTYDEDSDEITAVKSGYVFGDVIWNDNIKLSADKNDTFFIGHKDQPATLTIPEGTTLDIPGENNFCVGNANAKPGSKLINNGTINIKAGAVLGNCPNSVIANNGAMYALSGGQVYNYYDPSSQKGGLFQNSGTLDILSGGLFQNQNRIENSGTIDSPGSFYMVKLSGRDGSIDNKGTVNGFLIEMYSGRYVYAASGKTVLRTGQQLTLGPRPTTGTGFVLKVLDGAELTVEKGAIIDAKTNVTMDTVSDYIDLGDAIVVNGELWLPENTPEDVLDKMADKITGDGSIVTGSAAKYIVTVNLGGEVKAQFVDQGGTVDLAEEPVRDGYRFAGWYVKNGSSLEPFDLKTPVLQSMEIMSKWIGINIWTTPLTMETWTYGETAHGPEAEPRFGEAYYRYGGSPDGTFTDTVPSEAGTWYVKAYVDGTEEYTSLESAATSFRIEPKVYKEGGSIVISAVSDAETVKNLVIKDGGRILVKDRDYTVATAENENTVTVTVTFLGNYGGTAVREYHVAAEEPSEPEDPGEKPAEPEPEKPAEKPAEPEPEKPAEKPAEPEPEKPAEKPAEPQEDVEGNTILLNNKIKAVFSGAKIKVTWGRVSGAKGYDVYAAQCGKAIKLVKSVKGSKTTSYTFSKIGKKKISSKSDYKIKVRAYRTVNGKKRTIGSSLTLHIAGKNQKSYTNAKNIKVSASKIMVKKGASEKIKARTVKQNAKKKLFPKKHVAPYRYFSTNEKVASVSAGGTVKGKKKGTCTVYVVAANGVKKGVNVTVK